MSETIFALATPPGRSALAVIRLSGPRCHCALMALTNASDFEPRKANLKVILSKDHEAIDQALVIWFPGPSSFTGEDCAELQIHGSLAVISSISERLIELGLRLAIPGEFTRRAFQNGKLDLTEAEGLADLIDSQTQAQRRQALAQMSGSLRKLYETWRQALISILAALEGEIDFPDEEDVPDHLSSQAHEPLNALIASLEDHLDDGHRGERVRDGFHIALIGAPNAGKSSLLNKLASRDAAIVTEAPGTTRDIIEVPMVLNGYAVTLSDTAGLRHASDMIEAEGVRRARQRAKEADLRLAVIDVSRETLSDVEALLQGGDGVIFNKIDLANTNQADLIQVEGITQFQTSALDGRGLSELLGWLADCVQNRLSGSDSPALSRARHRQGVIKARDHLKQAHLKLLSAPELSAADVHLAMRALESLTGRVDIEDILDQVFNQFCIGK